jgi:acetylornithine deacetylase/succinyl-diaminopimelate desuccinylase-like protein
MIDDHTQRAPSFDLERIIKVLSGADPVLIDGVNHTITNRTAGSSGCMIAAQFLKAELERIVTNVKVHEFEPNNSAEHWSFVKREIMAPNVATFLKQSKVVVPKPHEIPEPFENAFTSYILARSQQLVANAEFKTWQNIVGRIPGSDRTKAYLLVAHYDSIASEVTKGLDGSRTYSFGKHAPGADANASGVAVALMIASELSRTKPRHDVIIALTTGEEVFLMGAIALVRKLRAERNDIVGVIDLNQIGYSANGNAADIYCQCDNQMGANKVLGRRVAGIAERRGAISFDVFEEVVAQGLGFSDKDAFLFLMNVPSILITEDYFSYPELKVPNGKQSPYIDGPKDTWDTLNYGYMKEIGLVLVEFFR